MALSTYDDLTRGVVLRCPAASIFLARQWISYAFRDVAERRRWSWLWKRGQFLLHALVNDGTAQVVQGSPNVVGTGTSFSSALINRQFRIGLQVPIYTITAVADATHLTLNEPWGGASASGVGYEIYNAYVTVPTDFQSFISVWDPRYNWQLWTNTTQSELNTWDAQRASQGTAYVLSPIDYDTTVTPPLPRYEIWPHVKQAYSYPFLYISRAQDLEDANASLPRYIRGDVLLEMALAQAARWPGAGQEKNPYFNLALAMQHDARALKMVQEMETQDDELNESDLMLYAPTQLPFAPIPWGDSRWLQNHEPI